MQFWIDRGGTFTDIVARRPDGSLVTHKLRTTTDDQSRAILTGIAELDGGGAWSRWPHGVRVAMPEGGGSSGSGSVR